MRKIKVQREGERDKGRHETDLHTSHICNAKEQHLSYYVKPCNARLHLEVGHNLNSRTCHWAGSQTCMVKRKTMHNACALKRLVLPQVEAFSSGMGPLDKTDMLSHSVRSARYNISNPLKLNSGCLDKAKQI
ncbi:hypothetical protein AMECASPLE_019682 [Ameca splendens]|uniref:Uncharacterized protein n=1 Tax=Ameca splendens TaxID=208324 RepID=A0ABV0XG31_9TELE